MAKITMKDLDELTCNFYAVDGSEETFEALVDGYKEYFGEDVYKDVLYVMFEHMSATMHDYLWFNVGG